MNKEYKLDLEIYPVELIKESIEAFEDISDIKIGAEGILTINGDDISEIEEVFNEFINYNISLINE